MRPKPAPLKQGAEGGRAGQGDQGRGTGHASSPEMDKELLHCDTRGQATVRPARDHNTYARHKEGDLNLLVHQEWA